MKLGFWSGWGKPVTLRVGAMGGGVVDTTAPTVTISSTETSPSPALPVPIAFTLSEVSTDFTVGDLTLNGCTVANFAGSGTAYTCEATPSTPNGTFTIDIAAGAFHDAAGNANLAATQFSFTSNAFTLADEFTTNAVAPLTSPRTCEPTGNLTLVQTDGQFSIASNKLVIPAQTTPTWSDLGFRHVAGFARAAGKALFFVWNHTTANLSLIGWAVASAISDTANSEGEAYFVGDNDLRFVANAANPVASLIVSFAASTDYRIAVVLRGTGSFIFVKGGTFSEWTLAWVGHIGTTATLYPRLVNRSSVATLDSFRLAQMGVPFTTDYGLATSQLAGARSAGDLFTHEGNCLIEFTTTTIPSAGQIEVRFRIQDTTNYWQVTIDSTGALDLDEVVAGTPTQRGTAAGVIANGDRIVILAVGASIKIYEANTLRITYNSAANFQTEINGKLETEGTGGSVSDIVTWPRTLSGAALTMINKYSP